MAATIEKRLRSAVKSVMFSNIVKIKEQRFKCVRLKWCNDKNIKKAHGQTVAITCTFVNKGIKSNPLYGNQSRRDEFNMLSNGRRYRDNPNYK